MMKARDKINEMLSEIINIRGREKVEAAEDGDSPVPISEYTQNSGGRSVGEPSASSGLFM